MNSAITPMPIMTQARPLRAFSPSMVIRRPNSQYAATYTGAYVTATNSR